MLSATLLLLLTAEPMPGLAVMDFATEGAAPEVGTAASGLVAHELERLQLFRVTSAETTRVILGVERQRQLLGCDNCSGSSLSNLTSFEYLVTGRLSRTGTAKDPTYNLLLTLMKTGDAAPVSSARLEAKGEERLLQEVPSTTLKLVGKLMEGRQGALVVSSSESGAAVKVDDSQVGVTPLQARVQIAAGPHLLTVEKDGFTQVKKEVRVSADQTSDEFVRLVPSPDMAEAYESKARTTRTLAWVAVGVGVAGAAAFVSGTVMSNDRYGDPARPHTFQYYRALLQTGDEGPDGYYRQRAQAIGNEVQTWQLVSYIGAGAAGVGAVTAAVLFIVGDPPGKYEAYRKSTGVVSMQVTPTVGAVNGVTLSGRF